MSTTSRLSRTQGKEILNHLMDHVLVRADDTPLKQSLKKAGIRNLMDLLTMPSQDIDSLTFDKSETEKDLPVLRSDKRLISVLIAFHRHHLESGRNMSKDEWLALTQEEFDEFRIGPLIDQETTGTQPRTSNPPSSSNKMTPAEQFKRAIKLDQSAFPTLKDERFNEPWHRSFETQADAQGVSNILNENYAPSSPEEQDLFILQQKFVYAVLEAKVAHRQRQAVCAQASIQQRCPKGLCLHQGTSPVLRQGQACRQRAQLLHLHHSHQ